MQPLSYNAWLYSFANPINYTDPMELSTINTCDLLQPDDREAVLLY